MQNRLCVFQSSQCRVALPHMDSVKKNIIEGKWPSDGLSANYWPITAAGDY